MTPQERQLKIRALLARLDALEGGPVGQEVKDLLSQEAEYARTKVLESPTNKAVSILSSELAKVKADPRIGNLEQGIESVSRETDGKLTEIITAFEGALSGLTQQLQETEGRGQTAISDTTRSVLEQLTQLADKFELDFAMLDEQGKRAILQSENVKQEISVIVKPLVEKDSNLEGLIGETGNKIASTNVRVSGVEETIQKLSEDIDSRLKRVQTAVNERGGGNMNRNIAIGGNTSVLSKWTDINLKAGSNTTITYSPNDTTGYTDITISASGGGGGSVTGIIRSIQTITTSQTAGAVAGTDYVYLCSAGINLTLPSAAGNTNQYTVKNISNSSVLVSGTIDNDGTGVIMPVKYTSIDLISNSVDWDIT